MPKLPRTSAEEILRVLRVFGFEVIRQRGSHVVLRCGNRGCVVPRHHEVAVGTLASILRQAGISPFDFMRAYEDTK